MEPQESTESPKKPAELGGLYPRQKSYSELYDERQQAKQMMQERFRVKAPTTQLVLRLYIIILGGIFFASYVQYAFQSTNVSAIFFTFLIAIVLFGIGAYIHQGIEKVFEQIDQQEIVFMLPYGVSFLLWLKPIATWAADDTKALVYVTILHACLTLGILLIMKMDFLQSIWRQLLLLLVCIVSLGVALFA